MTQEKQFSNPVTDPSELEDPMDTDTDSEAVRESVAAYIENNDTYDPATSPDPCRYPTGDQTASAPSPTDAGDSGEDMLIADGGPNTDHDWDDPEMSDSPEGSSIEEPNAAAALSLFLGGVVTVVGTIAVMWFLGEEVVATYGKLYGALYVTIVGALLLSVGLNFQ